MKVVDYDEKDDEKIIFSRFYKKDREFRSLRFRSMIEISIDDRNLLGNSGQMNFRASQIHPNLIIWMYFREIISKKFLPKDSSLENKTSTSKNSLKQMVRPSRKGKAFCVWRLTTSSTPTSIQPSCWNHLSSCRAPSQTRPMSTTKSNGSLSSNKPKPSSTKTI